MTGYAYKYLPAARARTSGLLACTRPPGSAMLSVRYPPPALTVQASEPEEQLPPPRPPIPNPQPVVPNGDYLTPNRPNLWFPTPPGGLHTWQTALYSSPNASLSSIPARGTHLYPTSRERGHSYDRPMFISQENLTSEPRTLGDEPETIQIHAPTRLQVLQQYEVLTTRTRGAVTLAPVPVLFCSNLRYQRREDMYVYRMLASSIKNF